jgi:P27 family predicted phage terminase small subunit
MVLVPAADFTPPAWLERAAKLQWRRLAPLLARNGLLSELDFDALAALCVVTVQWRAAIRQAHQSPLVPGANGAPRRSPYFTIANQSLVQMRALLADFGLTPRVRESGSPPPSAPTNPLDKFLRR